MSVMEWENAWEIIQEKNKKNAHTQTNKNCTEDHVRAERKPKRKRK